MAISGVTVTTRASDGTTDATFDTGSAQGTGVLPAELADFRAGGLVVSGSFPLATPGEHRLSVTYALRDHGSFKAGNYALTVTADTLPGELTEVAACGAGLILATLEVLAEGNDSTTVMVSLDKPAGPNGVKVFLTVSGTATRGKRDLSWHEWSNFGKGRIPIDRAGGDDYIFSDPTVNIAPGTKAGITYIFVLDDTVDDDDETVILDATAPALSLTANTLTLTIKDNDRAPTVPDEPEMTPTCDTATDGDYDSDDDGLIEVSCRAQFNAIHFDIDGDGSSVNTRYAAAFLNAASGMGCPQTGCKGYELTVDLDFDTNGNGRADASDYYITPDGDPINGWRGIGSYNSFGNKFAAVFEGNGHVIKNVYFYDASHNGLFSETASAAVIRNVGVEGVLVNGTSEHVGGLVGDNGGTIINSYATGSVSGHHSVGGLVGRSHTTSMIISSYSTVTVTGSNNDVGGLVGGNGGTIIASYATGSVTGTGGAHPFYTPGFASGNGHAIGGLVGVNHPDQKIIASYATGAVSAPKGRKVGGLVGYNLGSITASYAAGTVSGKKAASGLAYTDGVRGAPGTATDSYWDTETSGQTASAGGTGKTTAELESPTGYAGIYAGWNVDLDGDGNVDDPWDFGTSCQYPVLKHGSLNPDDQRAPCEPVATTTTPTPGSDGFTQVSTGMDHTCAIRTDGQVECWGLNIYGQATPPAGTFKQVSVRSFYTCGIRSGGTTDGQVECWGRHEFGAATPPTGTFKQVDTGRDYTCGIRSGGTTDGQIVCWTSAFERGGNYGHLPPAETFKQFAAWFMHTCGVKTDGQVVCWGINEWGRANPPAGTFRQVDVGGRHSCGVKTDGQVVCWGNNEWGQLNSPAGTFKQISAAVGHSCGVKTDDSVVCWGHNGSGETNPPAGAYRQVSSGSRYSCGVRTDGRVACWGRDEFGETRPPNQRGTPNQAPVVTNALGDVTFSNEGGTRQVSLVRREVDLDRDVGVFSDADNDYLNISASSSDETVATVSVDFSPLTNIVQRVVHTTLTVTTQARGTATITVTADDGNGGTVADSFTVTVKAAPVVAQPLADVTGLEMETTRDISLSGVFSDADGDALTITAASSDDAKATVSLSADQSKLTVAGVAEGSATITVTAQDADGNRVSDAFGVSVVEAEEPEQTPQEKYADLIAQMKEWRNDPQWVGHKSHTDRWDRALLAFGETVSDASLTPMTASEAQGYADQDWGARWVPVAAALRDIEASRSS